MVGSQRGYRIEREDCYLIRLCAWTFCFAHLVASRGDGHWRENAHVGGCQTIAAVLTLNISCFRLVMEFELLMEMPDALSS